MKPSARPSASIRLPLRSIPLRLRPVVVPPWPRLLSWATLLLLAIAAPLRPAHAFVAADADTIFNSYNAAFYVENDGKAYYKLKNNDDNSDAHNTGFWTLAEEIEMVADVYDRTKAPDTRAKLVALCNGFLAKHGQDWKSNVYNDDIEWACIAMCRAYLATGLPAFRDAAKLNFDTVWHRGWSTALDGGIFWRTDNQSKNACSNGPAVIAACYLHTMLNDPGYLDKAKQIYAWERAKLFDPVTGSVADNIKLDGTVNTHWIFTYNVGTFVGGADTLYQLTHAPSYLSDARLATLFLKNNLCDRNGLLPPSSDDGGDGGAFNAIGIRWIAKFVADQKLWGTFYPWLRANADAAWNVRRPSDGLSWCNWRQPTPPDNPRHAGGCFGSVVALQVVPCFRPFGF